MPLRQEGAAAETREVDLTELRKKYQELSRPDLARCFEEGDARSQQQIVQYLYSIGENIETLKEAVELEAEPRPVEGTVEPAPVIDPDAGAARYFPFVYGLPYDNRQTSSARDAAGGAWLARDENGIIIQAIPDGGAFPWADVTQFEFAFRDAEGIDHQALFNSRELQTGILILGIRRLNDDDEEFRFCYQQRGPLVLDTENFVAKIQVKRSEAANTFNVGDFSDKLPPHNENWQFRLLLPELHPRNYFPSGRKPSYFFNEVSAAIAAYLETLAEGECISDGDTLDVLLETVAGEPVAGDIVTLYRGSTVISRVYQSEDGGRWCDLRVFIDGNLVVHGSIQAHAIHLGQGVIRGTDGGLAIKVGPGVAIDEDGNVVPSLGAGLSITENRITAAVTAETLAEAIAQVRANPGGLTPGATPNSFMGNTRAAAERLRDTQGTTDPSWLASYDADGNSYITLHYD